jgi:hypothetical protein
VTKHSIYVVTELEPSDFKLERNEVFVKVAGALEDAMEAAQQRMDEKKPGETRLTWMRGEDAQTWDSARGPNVTFRIVRTDVDLPGA